MKPGKKSGALSKLGMKDVWIASDSIVSPLGFTALENYKNVTSGKSGLTIFTKFSETSPAVHAGWIDRVIPTPPEQKTFTKFEWLSILSVQDALTHLVLDPASARTIFILSTTKGNIELLDQGLSQDNRVYLHAAAKTIAEHFGNHRHPLIVSNACISGVMALLVGKRLLQSGKYDNAVVIGTDVLTRFVISGFQSLQAISQEPCRPFDVKRKGVNLGEAAATIILSTDPASIGAEKKIRITGGGLSNDANHISGPSRTGEELASAIGHAMREAEIQKKDIDFISAHGTATLYNDEMEAKAFNLAGLENVPLNSLKGYFGHTLGAAGIVEAVISKHAMMENALIPTAGFETLGVTRPVNVIKKFEHAKLVTCLKTASGFGGCNAVMVLNKVN